MKNGIIKLEATTTELVPFQGGHIEALRQGDRASVVIKRVCEHVGLAPQPQLTKLNQAAWAVVTMIVATGPDGKKYETACLDLDKFPMWLATIQPSKVKPEARAILVAYQNEAARVLGDHFFGSRAIQQAPDMAALLGVVTQQSQLIQAQSWGKTMQSPPVEPRFQPGEWGEHMARRRLLRDMGRMKTVNRGYAAALRRAHHWGSGVTP